MPLSTKLDRTLRAAEEGSDSEDYYEVSDRSSPSIIDTGEGAAVIGSDTDGEDENREDMMEGSENENFEQQLGKVSFGALAKAQDALAKQQTSNRKRKREDGPSELQEEKLQALRDRLRELKAEKLKSGGGPNKKSRTPATTKRNHKSDHVASEDSQSDASDSDGAPHARSSKHAPAVQSSKRAVTRRRNVVEVKKPASRDPRFDNLGGRRPDENELNKRYAFLDDYRASEMAELRATIKKTKNEEDKEKLKRKLMSMESQKKAKDSKEQQQSIIREHKKKEKEAIKQGKKPFYLKQSEQKKLALIDRFENMKSKDRDRAIERRRKKTTAKVRKNMPAERRAG